MWCDIDPSELSAFIDGEVSRERATAISAHAMGCASCRGELDRVRKTDDAVRCRAPAPGLAGMRADLLDQVDAIRRRSRLRVAIPVGAIAAAFVIGVCFTGSHPPEAPSTHSEPRIAQPSPMLEALELDAASLRLSLVAENPDPAVRQVLDHRLDTIVDRIGKLRAAAPSHN